TSSATISRSRFASGGFILSLPEELVNKLNCMQFTAPAKINLSLRIHRRRPDGFHEVETLMTPISLQDEISITRTNGESGIDFRCDDPSVPQDRTNLVV